MTITDILKCLKQQGRDIHRVHLYRILKKMRIKPIGILRQRPQHYPQYTDQRILMAWGSSAPAPGSKPSNKKQLATLAELKRKAKK